MTITERLPSFYIDVPALRPGTVGAYALAFTSAGVATVLRLAVDPYVEGVPFITFWPAVIITALISGLGAGLFCGALSAAASDFFVLEPRWSFYVQNPADVADLLLFVLLACFCVTIISQMRDAIERDQARKALQASTDHSVGPRRSAARIMAIRYANPHGLGG
jgi:two-component system, sensor histidine kinase PdtaS